jgi:hypothetical protein
VHGDGVIAGGELELRGPFLADVYAAGRSVRLDGSVAGNARIVGGEVSLGRDSVIDGGVSIGARRADIAGTIDGYLQVFAGDTTVSGRITGDLDVSGDKLHLAPSAEIAGELIFRGPQPASVAPGARVHGEVQHVPSSDAGEFEWWSAASGLFAVVSALGMAVVGAALWALWPNFTRLVIDAATRRSGRAFFAGLAVALGCPLAIALLLISIVGAPLAAFAACGYLISFPLGYSLAGATVAESLLERFRPRPVGKTTRRMFALLSSFLLLAMLGFVPVIGPISIAALTLVGMGALGLTAFDALRHGWRGQELGRPRESVQSATSGPASSAAHPT